MINEVRNTVLSILAKDNRGYVTPFEFNLYAKQAQLEVFERYIYLYSNAIIKQNQRMHGEGYSDVPKKLSEVLDTFYKVDSLTYTNPYFEAPADSYFIQKLVLTKNKEIEKVSQQKVLYLLASNLTSPSVAYPVYTLMDNDGTTTSRSNFMVYPDTIITNVDAHYLRYPREPKWTYTSVGGDPLFNPSPSLGYQDFELPMSDFSDLVVKILQYAGVSIREQEVMAAAKAEELQEIQQKQ
jgi:hypothetical protein